MFHAYILLTESGARAGFGHSPGFDWAYANTRAPTDLAVITPPVPAAYAEVVSGEVRRQLDGVSRAHPGRARHAAVRAGLRTARSVLRAFGLPGPAFLSAGSFWHSSRFDAERVRDRIPPPSLVTESAIALAGRSLLYEEAMRALASGGFSSLDGAHDLLAAICADGLGLLLPAVSISPLGARICNRCGSRGPFASTPCAHCGRQACFLCLQCRSMGPARECVPLYLVADHECASFRAGAVAEGAHLAMPHALTDAQEQAAGMLRDWYADGSTRDVLVWAVCGAGKTEVSFSAIHSALMAGQRVLFAAPRRDVVAELAPRVQAAFPGVTCSTFCGGSIGQRDYDARIILATTHQTMRFYRRFGLVVLDEADAYPFAGSEALASSVRRAIAPEGRLVIMTATPSRGHLARVNSGVLPCIRIPARHHRKPLPEPEVVTAPGSDLLPKVADIACASVRSGSPLLVFVPRRRQAQEVAGYLSGKVPGARVEWVHSQDPARDHKRAAIAGGKCDVLVSTSVMERGVTVDGVDVVVCYADDDIVFDYRALIQMAGRSGRTAANPGGRVWFVCANENWHARMAAGIIKEMNAEATARGLLAGSHG
ncbi:MAG TPA: helicase-related protein [Bacillota bacterium]|nr:helicase-related protein [Bacillota bacterium]